MSKRARVLEALGNLPYTTNDGGKWLKKALDPADIDVEVTGMPDTCTNARCILNYQLQSDVPLPDPMTYTATTTSSYDADLYVYQNPIIFGCAISYPASTSNPTDGTLTFGKSGTISLPAGSAPRTVNVILNDQIEGSNIHEKMAALKKYCQRQRVIYGGVQAIPACSALFDSGTIEATQQVFSPENRSVSDERYFSYRQGENNANQFIIVEKNNVSHLQIFNENDFPDAGNAIQNPASLYCRYKEGMYMPYKLRNPLNHEYIGTEEKTLTAAPFVMTTKAWARKYVAPILNEGEDEDEEEVQAQPERPVKVILGRLGQGEPDSGPWLPNTDPNSNWYPLTYTPVNNMFRMIDTDGEFHEFCIECYNKLGVRFYLYYYVQYPQGEDATRLTLTDKVIKTYMSDELDYQETSWNDGANQNNGTGSDIRIYPGDFAGGHMSVGDSNDLYFIPPFKDTNVGVVSFRSIGTQASVKLLFRIGVEMMITAGGIYSPFKHKSPKYDARAISSYIKACHNMRDAFLGDAATPEGHADYSEHISQIVTGEPDNIGNQGSSWYGKVSV